MRNVGIDKIAVYLSDQPGRIATVLPGQTECIPLRWLSFGQTLVAKVMGEVIAISPSEDFRAHEGWYWDVDPGKPTPWLASVRLVPGIRCSTRHK